MTLNDNNTQPFKQQNGIKLPHTWGNTNSTVPFLQSVQCLLVLSINYINTYRLYCWEIPFEAQVEEHVHFRQPAG